MKQLKYFFINLIFKSNNNDNNNDYNNSYNNFMYNRFLSIQDCIQEE